MEGIKKGKRNKCDKLHKRNHENINKRLWRTIASKIRFQSDPIWKVPNLSKKAFSKETFQLLNKNLNLVSKPKVYKKHRQRNANILQNNKIKRIL